MQTPAKINVSCCADSGRQYELIATRRADWGEEEAMRKEEKDEKRKLTMASQIEPIFFITRLLGISTATYAT